MYFKIITQGDFSLKNSKSDSYLLTAYSVDDEEQDYLSLYQINCLKELGISRTTPYLDLTERMKQSLLSYCRHFGTQHFFSYILVDKKVITDKSIFKKLLYALEFEPY